MTNSIENHLRYFKATSHQLPDSALQSSAPRRLQLGAAAMALCLTACQSAALPAENDSVLRRDRMGASLQNGSASIAIRPAPSMDGGADGGTQLFRLGERVDGVYSRLPGTPRDWISLAQANSADTSYVSFQYTNNPRPMNDGGVDAGTDLTVSGTVQFVPTQVGKYVLRAYANDNYVKLAESEAFEVQRVVQLSTSASQYVTGSQISVSYSGLQASSTNWIAIAKTGAPDTVYLQYQYVTAAQGTLSFAAPPVGTYEIRAFINGTYERVATSAPLAVVSSARVTATSSSFALGQTIRANFSGLPPGSALDWATVVSPSSALTEYGPFVYIPDGQTSGQVSVPGSAVAKTAVVRIFKASGFTLLAESIPFEIGPARDGGVSATIDAGL